MSRNRSNIESDDSAFEAAGTAKPVRSTQLLNGGDPGSSPTGMRTRVHIMAVSEELFAQEGYDRVSVRNIAVAAGVNIASINYHFGSKQRLFEALFELRASEISNARIALLDKAEATVGTKNQAQAVRAVVDAFVRPALSLVDPKAFGGRGKVVLQFLNRAIGMADEEVFLERHYGEVRSRFVNSLCSRVPEIPKEDMLYRYNLMVGALIYAMAGPERMLRVPSGVDVELDARSNDTEVFIDRFVDFFLAGFISESATGDRG